jgi:hypothetical protein
VVNPANVFKKVEWEGVGKKCQFCEQLMLVLSCSTSQHGDYHTSYLVMEMVCFLIELISSNCIHIVLSCYMHKRYEYKFQEMYKIQ